MSEIVKSEVTILTLMYNQAIPKTDGSGVYQGYQMTYKTKDGTEKRYTLAFVAIKNTPALGAIKECKAGDKVVFHWANKSLVNITKTNPQTQQATPNKSVTSSSDKTQLNIIMQNAYRHAVAVAIHNAGKKEISFTDVKDLAHLIAKDILEADLTPKVEPAKIINTSDVPEYHEAELEDLPY
jgi:predicted RNA-binding protein with PUA-like domain